MPAFSQTSQDRLSTCHMDLQRLFTEVIKDYDCTIICGHRGKVAQELAVMNNKSTTHWPFSKHNSTPSMAVDVGPWPLDWNDVRGICAFSGWVLCTAHRLYSEGVMTHRVRWGGDWDMDRNSSNQTFNDLVHFELLPGQ